ncbi:MAG: class IV adenylate cyclase [Candidatus Micrarchaeota archaeon]
MKLETEVKIAVKDPQGMRKRLKAAGAVHARTARQYDGIFDFPDGKLKKHGEVMRLRVFEPVWPDGEKKAIVTFKGKKREKGIAKVREETEFETDDIGGALLALHELGLEKKLEYLKVTEFYRLGKVKITLDHFPHYHELGYFIELEANKPEIEKGMKRLELSAKDVVHETYPEIVSRVYSHRT